MLKKLYSPSPDARAVVGQVRAEMAARGLTMKAVADRMGRNYDTARNWFVAERQLGIDELLSVLAILDLDWDVFMRRAQDRAALAPAAGAD